MSSKCLAIDSIVAGCFDLCVNSVAAGDLHPDVVSATEEGVAFQNHGVSVTSGGILRKYVAIVVRVRGVVGDVEHSTVSDSHKLDDIAVVLVRSFGTEGVAGDSNLGNSCPTQDCVGTAGNNDVTIGNSQLQLLAFVSTQTDECASGVLSEGR